VCSGLQVTGGTVFRPCRSCTEAFLITAIPGSPYFEDATYGVSLSSTLLPPGSPSSPLLYVQTDGPGYPVFGYAIDYETGALTAVPGSQPDFDSSTTATEALVADNQGKWVWSAAQGADLPAGLTMLPLAPTACWVLLSKQIAT
jgi:hypothetical protein